MSQWNTETLKDTDVRLQLEETLDEKMSNIKAQDDVNQLWSEIKTCITDTAEQVCGRHIPAKKQKWMTAEILHKMEERRQYKAVSYTHLTLPTILRV